MKVYDNIPCIEYLIVDLNNSNKEFKAKAKKEVIRNKSTKRTSREICTAI